MERKEITRDEQGYEKPVVVDYGDIEAITATNQTNNLSDVPIGTQADHGFSK
jgi:hypothetical protein